MINPGSIIYFIFIIFIVIAIILKKKPILIGALGLLAVGISETGSIFIGIQVAFRAILSTATDLLPIILLIGLVVAMTTMLKETKTDEMIIRPFRRVQKISIIYWLLGITVWFLTLFLWPTPAVTLLGAVIVPIINNTKINPLGLAVGLCIFGEGLGLAGDFIIQGAPGLLAKSAGLELNEVIEKSVPLVLGSGLIAAFIGYWVLLKLNKQQIDTKPIALQVKNRDQISPVLLEAETEPSEGQLKENKRYLLALITIAVYLLAIVWLFVGGVRGDSAAAATGGITIVVLIIGTILINYKTSLNTFVQYIQGGMRFSMEVFAPVVVIAGFFILGTQGGSEEILMRSGFGYLEQLAISLSKVIILNEVTCSLLVVFAAILGAISGSGFSALPLVGGVAAALGQTANLPVIQLGVLGQVAAIWTDATVIPWGFPAVVGAVTKTEAASIVRHNILPWIAALSFSFLWTLYML